MSALEEFTTSRLVLSKPTITDAAEIFERYAACPDVTRYLAWPRHMSVLDSEAFVTWSDREWETWDVGPYLVRSRSDGKLLGSTGLARADLEVAATGYVLAKDAWGHGFATEALAAVVEVGRELGLNRLDALCHPANVASYRVLEKCGFQKCVTSTELAEFPNLLPGVQQEVLSYEHRFAKVRV